MKSRHIKKPLGFTLQEAMIFVAVIGILTVIGMPAYQNYTRRLAFSKLVLAVIPRKAAVEIAIQTRGPSALTDLNGGKLGIPADIAVDDATHGEKVADGVITMTWQNDSTDLDGLTYTLTADGIGLPIKWSEGGSCLDIGLC